MIERKTLKKEVFLRHVASHLCPNDPKFSMVEDHESFEHYYFGGGYWRGNYYKEKDFIRLINPSVCQYNVEHVEAAINVLIHGCPGHIER